MLGCSVVLQKHIATGAFGMFGFPVIALVYAFIRWGIQGQIVDQTAALSAQIKELQATLQEQNAESELTRLMKPTDRREGPPEAAPAEP